MSGLLGGSVLDRLADLRRRGARPATPLAQLRAWRGLTQADVAGRAGVSPSLFGRWERGLNLPRPAHVPRLARILRVSESELNQLLGLVRVTPDLAHLYPGELGTGLGTLPRATGLSGAAVGRCVGVAGGTIRRWEVGRTVPSAPTRAAGRLPRRSRRGTAPARGGQTERALSRCAAPGASCVYACDLGSGTRVRARHRVSRCGKN